MANTRRSRQSKTDAERRQYWDTTIRSPKPTPTVQDTSPIIDTTTDTFAEETPPTTLVPTRQPSPFWKSLRDKLAEILVASILIPLLLWISYQLYSINREVGELRSEYRNVEKTQSKLDIKISDAEKRLDNRIDRLYENKQNAQPQTLPHK